jgi:hypothetical protein
VDAGLAQKVDDLQIAVLQGQKRNEEALAEVKAMMLQQVEYVQQQIVESSSLDGMFDAASGLASGLPAPYERARRATKLGVVKSVYEVPSAGYAAIIKVCRVRLEYLQAPSRDLPRLTVLAAPPTVLDRRDYPTPIPVMGFLLAVSLPSIWRGFFEAIDHQMSFAALPPRRAAKTAEQAPQAALSRGSSRTRFVRTATEESWYPRRVL